ncbi:MAG: GNAT family N-acetyltransferase [Pseudomonadota bacterium]
MNQIVRIKGTGGLDQLITISALTIDCMADVRYLHARAFKATAPAYFTDDEIGVFLDHINTQAYSDAIVKAVRAGNVFGARIDRELVATSGWDYGVARGSPAKLRWVFVNPMFQGQGIGRRMVSNVELDAMCAGYETMSARVLPTLSDFLGQLGYAETGRSAERFENSTLLSTHILKKRLMQSAINHFTRH